MGRTITLVKATAVAAAPNADGVSVFANTVNQFSGVFRARTPKSRYYTYLNDQAFIMKLATAAGVEIAATSRILPAFLQPTARVPKEYGAPVTYSAWRNTPLASSAGEPTQYNIETSARRRLRFESGQNLVLPQDWEFWLMVESPDLIDWTHANTFIELYVEESAVATQVAG